MSPDNDKQEETVNKVQQITAQSTTIEVGGTEFEIHPLKNKEFLNYVAEKNNRNEEQSEADTIISVITMILQKDDPSITEQDVADAPMALTTKTMEAMEQVNGLEDFFEKAAAQMQNQQR